MSAIDRLPTLQETQAVRRAVAKSAIPSRLETKTASDKDDAKQLEAFRKAVVHRDRGRCRVCGVRTIVTLALDPLRREVHHIVSRTNPLLRYDPRNGVTVCLLHHQRLTRHQLFVIGTAAQMFQAGRTRKWFLDATCDLTFTAKRPTP